MLLLELAALRRRGNIWGNSSSDTEAKFASDFCCCWINCVRNLPIFDSADFFSSLASSGNRKQSCLMFLCYLPLLLVLLLMLLLSFPLCNTHTILLSCFFCLSCFGCCVSVACSFAFYFFLRPLLWVFVQTRTHTGKSLLTLQDCCCFW